MKNPNTTPLEVALLERKVMLHELKKRSEMKPQDSLMKLAEDFLAHERQIEQLKQSFRRSVGFQEYALRNKTF